MQIHAAHGYQLSQWITPIFNRRTDEYGGSALNRFRIISDVYCAIREAVGEEFPVWIKINSPVRFREELLWRISLKWAGKPEGKVLMP